MKVWELADIMMKKTQEFWDSGARNEWLSDDDGYFKVYVRRTKIRGMFGRKDSLDIASVEVVEHLRGYKAFTLYLDRIEPTYDIYIENVLNERLSAFLKRRGYLEDVRYGWADTAAPCFYHKKG